MVSQTIAAASPLLSLKMAYRSPKTGLGGGVSQKKLASEAYHAIGGVARNSIANRAIVSLILMNSYSEACKGSGIRGGQDDDILIFKVGKPRAP